MDKLKKGNILSILALLMLVCGFARAEVSGFSAGFQVGYGDLVYSKKTRQGGANIAPYEHSVGEMFYGGVLGYKHFFSDKFGFRLLGYFNYTNPRFIDDEQRKQDIVVMGYGGAFDVLLNAVSKPSVDVGFFGGFYLGGKTYDSTRLNELEEQWKQAQNNATQTATQTITKTHLDVGANLGFRIHYMKYNGMEIGINLPFTEHLLYQRSAENLGISINYRHSSKANYAVYFRYTLSINLKKSGEQTPASTKSNSSPKTNQKSPQSRQNAKGAYANQRGASNNPYATRNASNPRSSTYRR